MPQAKKEKFNLLRDTFTKKTFINIFENESLQQFIVLFKFFYYYNKNQWFIIEIEV